MCVLLSRVICFGDTDLVEVYNLYNTNTNNKLNF